MKAIPKLSKSPSTDMLFMGNGIRIEHILQSLVNDAHMMIYHIKTEIIMTTDDMHDAINFLHRFGYYSDLFYLQLSKIKGRY